MSCPHLVLCILLFRVLMGGGKKSLTRPLQQAILPHLEISPESKATGACNTIVRVPTNNGSRFKLVAQNTESELLQCFSNAKKKKNNVQML